MWIDTHAHIAAPEFTADVDDVVARARQAGVGRIVCVADDLESAVRAIALSEAHEDVYATAGFHPHNAAKATEEDFARLEELLQHERVVAVGEIGLDYHYEFSPRDVQLRVFRRQVQLAHEYGLPIILHSRAAEHAVLDLLKEEGVPEAGGVMHCFWGDDGAAERSLAAGLYIGVGGPITFKNTQALRDIIQGLPLDRLVVETDSPYLAPVPNRGKRNEPAFVVHTGEALASLLGQDAEHVAETTSTNASRLFGIDLRC